PTHPLVRRSKKVISDYDYLFHTFPYTIWISGTNGKTTTTQMITHLLKDRGAVSGGNIGTPVADLDPRAPIWVLETSSFTLHYTQTAKPNLYILLPITPDHLSWHGDFKSYEAAKLKPIRALKEGEIAIVPREYRDIPTEGTVIGYRTPQDLAQYLEIEVERLSFQGPFLLDAVLAAAVQQILFFQVDYERLNSFQLDPHKQEEFFDSQGRLWVDDSKATNIDAALQAIRRYGERPLLLILGGDHKGVTLEPLIERLPPGTRVFAIGRATDHIVSLCRRHSVDVQESRTLRSAVQSMKRVHNRESVALLSPACASLDQFSSYRERGEQFKELVLRED
ncbi:MAG: UDP-N-acetylmuramoyl-L-alanine--D-glutamate ligase, partial [Epsilonproteobacteria bacterium]|nr:UDP-N-acetylmuramoyl-L-alanine--D-glutamate ligase [Campylobacterota bacterium]NPA57064.1 UDP-N-acetylmuramoyl-L-alanine--D-glutamate ligase [Campylobacterota bacterium]